METTTTELIRKGLESRLAALTEEYVAANDQWGAALSDADRVRLKRLVRDREKQMIDADQELKDFERAENDPQRRHLHVTEHLPKIDFKEVKKTLEKIFEKSGSENRAVIFLVQKSLKFGGEECAARIRALLNERTRDLIPWKLDFSLSAGSRDERGVLDGLAKHLKVPTEVPDLQQYAQQIVGKMCGSLQSGSIGFLDMRSCDNLHPRDRVMTWFLDVFWQRAVGILTNAAEQRAGVKFVALLLVDGELPTNCFPTTHLGNAKAFENGKMLLLSLKKWSKKEIDAWLIDYSGLSRDRINFLSAKIQELGLSPLEVCELLKKELAT